MEQAMETSDSILRVAPNTGDLLDTIEKPFYYLGLTTPTKRMLATGALTAGIIYAIHPKALFYSNTGQPKEWKLFSTAAGAVYVPWWGYAVAVGLLFGVFI